MRPLDVLGRLWRTLGTLLCFAVFFGCSALALPLALPLLVLAPGSPRRERFGKALVSRFFAFFVGLMRALGVLELRVEGREELRRARGLFLVANHPSLIDFVVLAGLVPRADVLVKSSLTRHWALRWPVLLAGYIPNDRGGETLEGCRRSLEAGNCLLVFPEGTRTPAGRPPAFKRGAAQLAVRCAGAVTPLVLNFPDNNLEKGGTWWLAPRRRLNLRVRVAEPLPTAPFLERAQGSQSLAARDFTAALERRFHEVLDLG